MKISRSIRLKASLRRAPRRSTLICWLNTKISASSVARDRKRSVNIRQISLHRSNITQQHRPILDQPPAVTVGTADVQASLINSLAKDEDSVMASQPRKVLLFSGHMIDSPSR